MSQEQLQQPNSGREFMRNGTLLTQRQNLNQSKESIYVQLPTHIRCLLTEIVKVDLGQKQVQCKFTIYISIDTTLSQDNINNIQSCNKKKIDLEKWRKFLTNNLTVKCATQVIDIVNADQSQDLYSTKSQEDDDSQSESEGVYYWAKMKKQNKQSPQVTYKIQGIFDCKFQLQNMFFPYHHINSGLQVKLRSQYYDLVLIKYNLLKQKKLPDDHSKQYDIRQQFYLKFIEESYSNFGNYRINFSSQTYQSINTIVNTKVISDIKRSSVESASQEPNSINSTQFSFQIYSYNSPFILRYLVPLLVLCFVSLMTYFADSRQVASIFGNIILISITLIQQLSNFRQSIYDNNSLNFYQATLLAIICVNFLLAIITVNNYYQLVTSGASQVQQKQANINHPIFWVSLGFATFWILIIVVMILYFKFKVQTQYSWQAHQKIKGKNFNQLQIWNEELFETGNIINDENNPINTQKIKTA